MDAGTLPRFITDQHQFKIVRAVDALPRVVPAVPLAERDQFSGGMDVRNKASV
jgi:hypothetical protein